MPVHTDKLLHLLGLLLLSYWLVKFTIMSLVTSETVQHFHVRAESQNVDKIVTELTYRQFLQNIQSEEAFRTEFINILRKSRFETYFFETPKVSKISLDDVKFEFILSDAKDLQNVKADESTFQEYFVECKDSRVVTFPNLGLDAVLVAPCPGNSLNLNHFSSLGPFVRTGDNSQVHQFWKEAARKMLETVSRKVVLRRELSLVIIGMQGTQPTWMSTSGLGVYWLHMRWVSAKYYP